MCIAWIGRLHLGGTGMPAARESQNGQINIVFQRDDASTAQGHNLLVQLER